MTALAVDASVTLKWLFPHRDGEAHVGQALRVLGHIRRGQVSVLQPPHWLAEVAAVVSRLEPRRAPEVIDVLHAMEFAVADGVEVYQRACELAVALRQHLFDTLYHAVALSQPEGVLVTADEQYYRRAVGAGQGYPPPRLPVSGPRPVSSPRPPMPQEEVDAGSQRARESLERRLSFARTMG